MGHRFLTAIKLILLGFLSLFWFVFIQVEYEIITKPELQNDVPLIKGIYAVYLIGFLLLISGGAIVFLFRQLWGKFKSSRPS